MPQRTRSSEFIAGCRGLSTITNIPLPSIMVFPWVRAMLPQALSSTYLCETCGGAEGYPTLNTAVLSKPSFSFWGLYKSELEYLKRGCVDPRLPEILERNTKPCKAHQRRLICRRSHELWHLHVSWLKASQEMLHILQDGYVGLQVHRRA